MNKPPLAWYLDITPNQMFSLYDYPIPGKRGLPLCEKHGRQLELNEVGDLDKEAMKHLIRTFAQSAKANNYRD